MSESIRFNRVSVAFSNQGKTFTAVDKVTLAVNKGEFFGIIGPSGAGKSTLVRTVNLLQRPTSGNVYIDGQDVTSYKGRELSALRLRIGMIFQHFNLVRNSTVADNVAFALLASGTQKAKIRPRVLELLKLTGLSDKADLYPAALSGGQKQRVAIARALANNPEILLCDEATSALDPENTADVIAALRDIKAQYPLTVLFITHQEQVARSLFDRIAVMERGRIVEQGTAYEIFAHPQSKAAQDLIARSHGTEIPKEVAASLQDLLVITFREEHAYDALIAETSRKFGTDLSIIAGRIDYIQGKPLGTLVVSLGGLDPKKRVQVLAFIAERAWIQPYKKEEFDV
ncbi:MAG: ATP-binding cassette domain-containing protein [Succinivibrio sp.]|jgi:D-methionine transport system ATP-binding protein|nr:ATP-binding cassette domain-containing protein [Succinivibrio sp.]